MRVFVLHTGPNVCRDERNLSDKVSPSLLSVITGLGKTPRTPTDVVQDEPPAAAIIAAKPVARLNILYQHSKGGSGAKPAVLPFSFQHSEHTYTATSLCGLLEIYLYPLVPMPCCTSGARAHPGGDRMLHHTATAA